MVDALKRASAKRITVVAPFYPYARQDKKHRGREPISARLIADLFKTAGANRLMSVDLHAAQIQGFFDGPVDHLWALPVLADYVVAKYDTAEMTVVSPDAGRVRLADMWTDRLNCRAGDHPQAARPRRRQPGRRARGGRRGRGPGLPAGRRHDRHRRHHLPGRRGAEGPRGEGGDRRRDPPVLSGPAIDRLKATAFEEVIVTNTLPIPPGAPLRRSDRAVDRPADRPGDPRGLRGRLRDQPLRRPELAARTALSCRLRVASTTSNFGLQRQGGRAQRVVGCRNAAQLAAQEPLG